MKLLAYVCVPVIFGFIGYLLLWTALKPVWEIASAAAGVLVADEAPNFDASLASIYDPDAAEDNPVPVYYDKEQGSSGDTSETSPTQESEASPAEAETPETTAETQRSSESEDTGRKEPYILITDIEFPLTGTRYGNISCERVEMDAPVYWYDTNDILAYGVGQSIASFLPGFGRSIILSGHNTTYFKCLQDVEEGDVIHLDTNYCKYEYTVTKVEVLDENDLTDVLIEKMGQEEKEELIMYTCYPFYAISGRKTQRLTVYADRTKGINVKWRNMDE